MLNAKRDRSAIFIILMWSNSFATNFANKRLKLLCYIKYPRFTEKAALIKMVFAENIEWNLYGNIPFVKF